MYWVDTGSQNAGVAPSTDLRTWTTTPAMVEIGRTTPDDEGLHRVTLRSPVPVETAATSHFRIHVGAVGGG